MNPLPSKLPWTPYVDGNDIVVTNIAATCFGGKYDTGDNGETESGVKNDGSDPNLMGCALPFKGPHIPWKTPVMVWKISEGEQSALKCLLIDNGPRVSDYPTHALDLNPNAVLHFSPQWNPKTVANTWAQSGFCYRIIGGAQWVS
ncbi:MAG: hypothetical protein B7Z37_22440 [Verrucomicrobia bacterium 12-59-8]|nr:MAG: hypothetical protein B7Z37_22440 [Verrucomicrobia bacterium 12-59-8]